jgi:hypothetical protein
MKFFEYLIQNYGTDLLAMLFTYIGIISIVLIFFPLRKIIAFLKQVISIITSLFKR